MAVVAPFRGVRYNPEKIAHLEDVVTSPYDVISAEAGVELLEKNPYSMLNLDLRNISQDDAGDDDRYQRGRSRFDGWQDEVVLSDLLIHDYLGLRFEKCVKDKLISYFSDPDAALDAAVKKSVLEDVQTPLFFLLNSTRVDQVISVADSGEIMTGLLINKLVSTEIIVLPE